MVQADQESRKNRYDEQQTSNYTLSTKFNKQLQREINDAMKINESDVSREIVFRKHSAIYGRFDSKRKPGRRLSPHEAAINEASAQICLLDKSFLVRRDELFMMCRQTLKEIAFQGKKQSRNAKKVKLAKTENVSANSPTCSDVLTQMDSNAKDTTNTVCEQSLLTFNPNQVASTDASQGSSTFLQSQKASSLEMKIEALNNRIATGNHFETSINSNSVVNTGLVNNMTTSNAMFNDGTFTPLLAQGASPNLLANQFASTLQPVNMSNFRAHFWPSGTGNPEINFLHSALNMAHANSAGPVGIPMQVNKLEPISP